MKLSDLNPGEYAIIAIVGQLDLPAVVKRKLLSMGITPNTSFRLLRKAPLGSGLELDIRGSRLCMRRDLADIIEVVKIEVVELEVEEANG
ncbi:ferrous iron transport protein A [Shewanella sp. D64]|uniref:FeoA family protein n=1 Tax=unclassified Shewanella TaxID=196818 RepID=UPI0022BA325F|nr:MULTISPECIES: FeoA family protein [unclassified Shewanella]MEC4728342.1 ferrous iron transport protein A [Shewanella sp. D64]MEC4737324.1 ferrous iron transport protein A [Shewanella sp. E94]WBJ93700.1 ferrous iron transport protein A [Shewanella sp. MTB7]